MKIYTKPAVTFVSLTSSERIGACHEKITGANATHLANGKDNCTPTGIIVGFDTVS